MKRILKILIESDKPQKRYSKLYCQLNNVPHEYLLSVFPPFFHIIILVPLKNALPNLTASSARS